ncbi:Predicted small integral membrane protein (DUF2160) [Moritella viscosa]|uniref:Predicted small integral membrane protein (DUF2160) n=1 Tax=Moritella viscosa TaxID=80854 RepID=A0A1K9ZMB2_9GAMM|nr:Predicted small integral membrane protein (DUF2160) [Moritella viscosa]
MKLFSIMYISLSCKVFIFLFFIVIAKLNQTTSIYMFSVTLIWAG